MNIHYFHNRKYDKTDKWCYRVSPRGGQTIALEVVEPWLFQQLKLGDTLEKRIGKAVCSTDDNYNKKMGRDLAVSRLKLTKLEVTAVINRDTDREIVTLRDAEGSLYYLRKHKEQIHFEDYNHV